MLLLLLGAQSAAMSGESLEPAELVGIWKMCFEPGLEDLYEPSEGYLTIMPDGTYFEIRWDCCQDTPNSESNIYSVEDSQVQFENVRVEGSSYSIVREFVPSASAVFFDDLHGEPVVTDALKVGKTLDYAYCRIYPTPESDLSSTSSGSPTNR